MPGVLACAVALEVLGEQPAHMRGLNLMPILALPVFGAGSPNSRASCNTGTRTVCSGKGASCWRMLVWVAVLLERMKGNPVGCCVPPRFAGARRMEDLLCRVSFA